MNASLIPGTPTLRNLLSLCSIEDCICSYDMLSWRIGDSFNWRFCCAKISTLYISKVSIIRFNLLIPLCSIQFIAVLWPIHTQHDIVRHRRSISVEAFTCCAISSDIVRRLPHKLNWTNVNDNLTQNKTHMFCVRTSRTTSYDNVRHHATSSAVGRRAVCECALSLPVFRCCSG